jgi:hypothetical protein
MLLPKKIFDRDFFIEKVLTNFDKEGTRNYPTKYSKGIFLHLDNDIPYQPLEHFDRFGITILLHPPYGRDFALGDFWLFGASKKSWKDLRLGVQSKC